MEFGSPIGEGPSRANSSPRAWLARIVLAGAFALVLVALSGTGAAASEPIGTLVDEGAHVMDATAEAVTEASDPLVEPIAAGTEPVVQPATGLAGAVLAPIAPGVPIVPPLPTLPSLPLVPVTPPALPGIPVLTTHFEPEMAELPGTLDAITDVPVVDSRPNPAPGPLEAPISESPVGSMASVVDGLMEAGAAVAQELEQVVDATIPSASFMGDGGTNVMAAVLIGLAMAMAAGWSKLAGQVRLRPLGLQLAPPVPPG